MDPHSDLAQRQQQYDRSRRNRNHPTAEDLRRARFGENMLHETQRGPSKHESGFAPIKAPTPEVIEELSRMQRVRIRLRDGQHGAIT